MTNSVDPDHSPVVQLYTILALLSTIGFGCNVTTVYSSVLTRLRFCAIVAQNFEYDAAKTVPTGHLAHIDFGLSQDFESVGIPVVVTAILIGVLDF